MIDHHVFARSLGFLSSRLHLLVSCVAFNGFLVNWRVGWELRTSRIPNDNVFGWISGVLSFSFAFFLVGLFFFFGARDLLCVAVGPFLLSIF
jgi:hypothetical protein